MQAFYDSHVHSHWSDDCTQSFDEIYAAAVRVGLRGVTITDHANLSIIEEANTFASIAGSVREARNANSQYGGGVEVFCGVELADQFVDPANTRKLLTLADYDVVIGSVHRLRFEQWTDFYSKIDFGADFTPELLHGYLRAYFQELLRVAAESDYDILAHLTCPLRYINGKYKRDITLDAHRAEIDDILRCVIQREKALEVNTSGVHAVYGDLMPDEAILRRYIALGGRRITLGSDAHTPERVGTALAEAARSLTKLGFWGYDHYVRRQPEFVPFQMEGL